ncbi:MAG: hypothetical protein WEB09_02500 [Nitriliruptor sp.]
MLSFFTTSFASFAGPVRPVVDLPGRLHRSARRTSRHMRVVQLLVGLLGVGVGVALIVEAGLGVASWDLLNVALAARFDLPLGLVAIVVGFGAGGLAVLLGARVRASSLVPLFVVAPVLQAGVALVDTPAGFGGQLTMLVAGMAVLALGVGAYVGSENGAGPADMLFLRLAERGLPIWVARVAVDGVVVTAGWLLGGPLGVGTVIVTVCLGPMVAVTMRWFTLDAARSSVVRRAVLQHPSNWNAGEQLTSAT